MTDAWHFFEGTRRGKLAQIFVNTGITERAPLAGLPWCLRFSVALNEARDDGLANARESGKLARIEDALLNHSLTSKHLEYIGRITSAGERSWLLYASEEAPRQVLFDADEQSQHYDVEFEALHDPEWKSYRELAPTQLDWLYVENEKRLRELEREGVRLLDEHQVEHRVSFENAVAAQHFAGAIKKLEAQVLDDHPERLRFVRTHALDMASLSAVTAALTLYAQEFDGRYLGWDLPAAR